MSNKPIPELLMELPDDTALRRSRNALECGTGEEIADLCRKYLNALSDYRDELLKLRSLRGLSRQPGNQATERARAAVRCAVEDVTTAHHETQKLLESLTLINGWDAVATFCRAAYLGSTDWEKRGGRVASDKAELSLTLGDAVEIASRLRSEAYVSARVGAAKE